MEVHEALAARHSVRGFLSKPVPRPVLNELLARAQLAPSWCNIQPWRVWLTSGVVTAGLVEALLAASKAGIPSPDLAFPGLYPEPYDRHRKECGKALYEAMGIARGDSKGRYDAWMRNLQAFGAPHVMIVAMDRRFATYAALDIGCWLQSLWLAATELGLGMCAQASLGAFPAAVRTVLPVPSELAILFGVSIGYEDPSVPANACRTTRAPVDDNVTFVG